MENNIIKTTLSYDFYKAKIIKVKDIKFNKEFRKYCKENLCNNYKRNYSCPPYCGSFNVLYSKVNNFENALILQSIYFMDTHNKDLIELAKKQHNTKTLLLKKYFNDNGFKVLIAGAGNCDLCEKCSLTQGVACKNKKERFSSVSAYCIDVKDLFIKTELENVFSNEKMSLVSIVFF